MKKRPLKNSDTIVAQATPSGRGGVGIIRVSGVLASEVAKQVLGFVPTIRHAHFGSFHGKDRVVIDQGIALFFKAPHSFTGEDVLELQGHGGPVVMDLLLQETIQHGARLARAGEFTQRAFLNDKIDLVEAEAVADLINAESVQAARSALRSLQGEFSRYIDGVLAKLIHLRMYVEACIDFPEEEVDFLADNQLKAALSALVSMVDALQESAKQGALLKEGMSVVIAGKPNAGKSSLLNGLSGREAAIVTEVAGTTRDIIKELITLDGVPVHVVDTAGLRDTQDVIEQEGVKRAKEAINQADRVLLVVDASKENDPESLLKAWKKELPAGVPVTIVMNKIDLVDAQPGLFMCGDTACIRLSVKKAIGINLLKEHLLKSIGKTTTTEGGFIARRRHLDAISRAKAAVLSGQKQLCEQQAGELLAEELKVAQNALSEITGKFTADDLLGEIFSSFCIGK